MKFSPLKPFGLLVEAEPGTRARDLPRADILSLVSEHKLVLLRGLAPFEPEELLGFAARDPGRDLMGPMEELGAGSVPIHWDGAFHLEPRTLLFHCLQAGGGGTMFVDSERIWVDAPTAVRSRWKKIELTYEKEMTAKQGGRITVPMVQHHPDKPVTILRYADPSGSALTEVAGLRSGKEDFFSEMGSLLGSGKYRYEHEWEQNDLLLADNYSLLHGHRVSSDASPRRLRRALIR